MYKEFSQIADHSRIWVYPCNRMLSEQENLQAQTYCKEFVEGWTAHSVELQGSSAVIQNRFIILAVDENSHGASGCSIDSSVNFVKSLGAKLGVEFLNGGKVALQLDTGIELVTTKEVSNLFDLGQIDENTVLYDHLVPTMGEFRSRWETSIANSWLKRFIRKKEEV